MTEKLITKKNLVKICVQKRTHEAKMCACALKRAHMHIYASCAHDFTQNFTKIVLIVHHYVMTPNSKFHKEWSLNCGDICKIALNMHARGMIEHAKFQHLRMHLFAFCARILTLIFTKTLVGSPLRCYKLKFQIPCRSNLPFRRYLQKKFRHHCMLT